MSATPTAAPPKVTTFLAERPPMNPAEALAKVGGKPTVRALRAAARIAAKKRGTKIPGHLLRQLSRLTGGWKADCLKQSAGKYVGCSAGERKFHVLRLGDLEVRFAADFGTYAPVAYLLFRNALLGRIGGSESYAIVYNDDVWLDKKKLLALVAMLPTVTVTVG